MISLLLLDAVHALASPKKLHADLRRSPPHAPSTRLYRHARSFAVLGVRLLFLCISPPFVLVLQSIHSLEQPPSGSRHSFQPPLSSSRVSRPAHALTPPTEPLDLVPTPALSSANVQSATNPYDAAPLDHSRRARCPGLARLGQPLHLQTRRRVALQGRRLFYRVVARRA